MKNSQVLLRDEQYSRLQKTYVQTDKERSTLIRDDSASASQTQLKKKDQWKQALADVCGIWSDHAGIEEHSGNFRQDFARRFHR